MLYFFCSYLHCIVIYSSSFQASEIAAIYEKRGKYSSYYTRLLSNNQFTAITKNEFKVVIKSDSKQHKVTSNQTISQSNVFGNSVIVRQMVLVLAIANQAFECYCFNTVIQCNTDTEILTKLHYRQQIRIKIFVTYLHWKAPYMDTLT